MLAKLQVRYATVIKICSNLKEDPEKAGQAVGSWMVVKENLGIFKKAM